MVVISPLWVMLPEPAVTWPPMGAAMLSTGSMVAASIASGTSSSNPFSA